MKMRLVAPKLALFAALSAPAYGQGDVHRFDIHSRVVGVEYAIEVVLPASAVSDSTYPVVYCTDWFMIGDYLKALPRLMDLGRLTEPFALVGISQPGGAHEWATMRTRDFTPAHPTDAYSRENTYPSAIELTGGASRFVAFLEKELFPRIESAYPVDPSRRGFVGYSLGGLLGAHVLTTTPDLFRYYLLGSPSVWFNEYGLALELEGTPATNLENIAGLYLSVGEEESWEMLKGFGLVRDALLAKGLEPPRARMEIIEASGHVGAMPIALYNGMRFLFRVD